MEIDYGTLRSQEWAVNPDLSVVVPIYNEEHGINEFAKQLKSNLDDLKIEY